jgi:hypothetical protein
MPGSDLKPTTMRLRARVTTLPSAILPEQRTSHKYGHSHTNTATSGLHCIMAPSQMLTRHSGSENGWWPAPAALHFGEGG